MILLSDIQLVRRRDRGVWSEQGWVCQAAIMKAETGTDVEGCERR